MLEATLLEPGSLLGIVRFHRGGDVAGAVGALVRGGIELVEVTIDTPGALEVVARLRGGARWCRDGRRSEQVRAAAAAGARFVVSPGFVPEVVETALSSASSRCPASSRRPKSSPHARPARA